MAADSANIGNKIKQERRRQMLKQRDLARAIGLTPGGLALIEKGMRSPSKEVLKKIASALGLPLGPFFLTDDEHETKGAGATEYQMLFNKPNRVTPHDLILIEKHIKETLEPEDYARKLRKDLGNMDGPIDSLSAARELGIKVSEDQFKGFAGALIRADKRFLILLAIDLYKLKKNFVIAHEIGHWYMHSQSDGQFMCRPEDIEKYTIQDSVERQANRFAAEFLMPVKAFKQVMKGAKPSLSTIISLADDFRVSIQAAAIRCVELTKFPCAIILTDTGIVKWFSKSPSFPYYLEKDRAPSENTLASRFFTMSSPPSEILRARVPLTAWVQAGGEKKKILVEESMYFPTYQCALSLLVEGK